MSALVPPQQSAPPALGARVLGIDPGYDRCGYAVVEAQSRTRFALRASGTLTTPRGDALPLRLCALARQLETVLELWQPSCVAVEELFFNRNAKTAMAVSQARGVILERSAAAGVGVFEYAPSQVKSQLTGSGRADKAQVAFMAARLVGVREGSRLDDELDAIAVALCHSLRASIPTALRGGR